MSLDPLPEQTPPLDGLTKTLLTALSILAIVLALAGATLTNTGCDFAHRIGLGPEPDDTLVLTLTHTLEGDCLTAEYLAFAQDFREVYVPDLGAGLPDVLATTLAIQARINALPPATCPMTIRTFVGLDGVQILSFATALPQE